MRNKFVYWHPGYSPTFVINGLDVLVLIFWLYLKVFVCLDWVFVLKDMKIYSGEQTVARRTQTYVGVLAQLWIQIQKELGCGKYFGKHFWSFEEKKMFNTAHVLCGEIQFCFLHLFVFFS